MSAFRPLTSASIRWRSYEPGGLQQFDLRAAPGGFCGAGVAIGPASERSALWFEIRLRDDWTVQALDLGMTDGRRLHLRHDGSGCWTDSGGAGVEVLSGCIDLDLQFTPFTNTLPIRRVDWDIGQTREFRMAYVSVSDLRLSSDGQRYTRIAAHSFGYEAVDGSFSATIDIDADGLVTRYPPLFERA